MEDPSDEYVAELLAKDARVSAKNYSAHGLQAFLPRRSVNNVPKPNTRFLRTIIKETDTHNAALKAREESEAHVRLQKLRHQTERSETEGKRSGHGDNGRRKRPRLNEINGILRSRSDDHKRSRQAKDRDTRSDHDRSSRHNREEPSSDKDDEETRRSRRRHGDHSSRNRQERSKIEEESERDEIKTHTKERRRRRRSRSPSRRDRHRSSHHSHRRVRSATPETEGHGVSHQDPQQLHDSSKRAKTTQESDSDPLETLGLIGPKPPPPAPTIKSRGRGAFASSSSAIDQHFTSSYDPTIDIVPDMADEDGDDWDLALEALKDRQKWQQNQADRMRQAGFTDGEVAKWEKQGKAGADGREEDVRWKGRGEGREWDRGKVVDADGGVTTQAEWGRLKGT